MKWFDPVKGYGFLVPTDASDAEGDVLLHMSVLRQAGFSTVAEDAVVLCETVLSDRGRQASRVLSIDETAPVRAPEQEAGAGSRADAETAGALEPARVKWFDKAKGFGFVNLYGDSTDVFVHMEVLRRFGLPDLEAGEAVLVRAVEGPRGRMASEVRPWDFSFRE